MTSQPGPDASVPDASVPDASLLHASLPDALAGAVVVYWRPGCPFCSSLRRQLRRAGIELVEPTGWLAQRRNKRRSR